MHARVRRDHRPPAHRRAPRRRRRPPPGAPRRAEHRRPSLRTRLGWLLVRWGQRLAPDATRRAPDVARPRWGHDRRRRRTGPEVPHAAPAHRRQGDAGAGPPGARRPARAAHARRPDDGHRGRRGARRVAGQHVVPPAHAGQVRLRRGGARRHRPPAAVAAGRARPQLRGRRRRDHDGRRPQPGRPLRPAHCSSAGGSGS